MTSIKSALAPAAYPLASLALLAGLLAAGCDRMDMNTYYSSEQRLSKGLAVILPGIEGESLANQSIREGLDRAGIPYALVIYRWGFPIPGIGLLVNQTDAEGNRRAAQELAQRIAQYQRNHPDRPVYMIGHSGGGGVAIFTLEALAATPGAKPIEGAFLLAASLSADYPLSGALRMTRRGIVNVYNPDDVGLLGVGTGIFGNVDGGHGDSCGRTGFHRSYPKLFQRKLTSEMLGVVADPHYLPTSADVVARAAPLWVKAKTWPAPSIVPQYR